MFDNAMAEAFKKWLLALAIFLLAALARLGKLALFVMAMDGHGRRTWPLP